MSAKWGVCTRPPTGWRCSRDEDHDGPCAATEWSLTDWAFHDIALYGNAFLHATAEGVVRLDPRRVQIETSP